MVHGAGGGSRRERRTELLHGCLRRIDGGLRTVEAHGVGYHAGHVRWCHAIRSCVHQGLRELSPVKVNSGLLSALDELSLVRSCLELFIIRDRLVSALLLLLGAVGAAVEVAVALNFSGSVGVIRSSKKRLFSFCKRADEHGSRVRWNDLPSAAGDACALNAASSRHGHGR